MVLLVILLVAMVDFFIGCVLPPSTEQMAKGFVGWRGKITYTCYDILSASSHHIYFVF